MADHSHPLSTISVANTAGRCTTKTTSSHGGRGRSFSMDPSEDCRRLRPSRWRLRLVASSIALMVGTSAFTGHPMLDRVGWIMVAALFSVSLCGAEALAQGRYAGRRLEEALRLLQAGGLRIVYSSEIVRADMRVVTEPRAHGMRAVLDELLKPYHLKAEDGPGGTIKIVRAKPTEPAPASVRPPDSRSKAKNARHTDDAAGLTTYIEHVAV